MYVCLCHGVSDHDIRDAAQSGVDSMEMLSAVTGAGTCCGACRPMAKTILHSAREEATAEPASNGLCYA